MGLNGDKNSAPANNNAVFPDFNTQLLFPEYLIIFQVDRHICVAIGQGVIFGIGKGVRDEKLIFLCG